MKRCHHLPGTAFAMFISGFGFITAMLTACNTHQEQAEARSSRLRCLHGRRSGMYNILIVDDEPFICQGLSSLLQSSGLAISQLHTALSGQEALDYLRMEDIDLLITDIQMGAM